MKLLDVRIDDVAIPLPVRNGLWIEHCPFCTFRLLVVQDDMGRGEERGQDALEDHVAAIHYGLANLMEA